MQDPRALARRRRRFGVAAACCGALALASTSALADEFLDRVERAGTLAQAERYNDALAELDAAYALRQAPRVLYMRAKVQQRLGDAKAALASYERFLAADADPDPRYRTDAQEQVARLKHLLGKDSPPVGAPPPGEGAPGFQDPRLDVHYEMKANTGLMAGGAVLFGAAYMGAVVTGSIFLAPGNASCVAYYGNCPGGNLQVAAGTLLIPFLGPFITAFAYRDPTWSSSWPLVDGVAQIGGLVMMVYAAKNPKKVPVFGDRFQVLPLNAKGGGGLQAIGRF